MSIIELEVANITDSHVFYRNLFGIRASKLDLESVEFITHDLHLKLHLSDNELKPGSNVISTNEEIEQVYHRMSRYMLRNNPFGECQVLQGVFHVIDPDGHRWIVRRKDEKTEIDTNKCYILSNT